MNSKAFAIFVGAIMVFSVFAGYVMMGSDQGSIPVETTESDSLQDFGATGNLVDWNFDGLGDVLEMAPESTVMAYWLDLNASMNLTRAASASLPQSIGLLYGSQLYSSKIERLAGINFNGSWTEFHWIKPYQIGYGSLVIPYENYMMIPTGNDYVTVLGRPVLFGIQNQVQQVIDVISGGLSAGGFTLVDQRRADLQVAALGRGGNSMPLSGAYDQFYLEAGRENGSDERYDLDARMLSAEAVSSQKFKEIASMNNLSYSAEGPEERIFGSVAKENLQNVLMAVLGSETKSYTKIVE